MTEVAGGDIEAIPCRLSGTYRRAFDQTPYEVGVIDAMGVGIYGALGGISGSPVVDANGDLLGLVSMNYFGGRSRVFGMLPRQYAEAALANIRTAAKREGKMVSSDAWRDIAPGRSIAIANVWGDAHQVSTGTVGMRRGNVVLLFGHSVGRRGACNKGLLLAPVVGATDDTHNANKVCEFGPVVGTVIYNGSHGAVAVLGRAPRVVEVYCQIQGTGARPEGLHYYVTEEEGSWKQNVANALADAIAGADIGGHVSIKRVAPTGECIEDLGRRRVGEMNEMVEVLCSTLSDHEIRLSVSTGSTAE